MAKSIYIDAAVQQVYEVEVPEGDDRLKKLQALVGGYLEIAHQWETADVCFVDEEGTFKPQRHFFRLALRGDCPLAGSGVIVGPERFDEDGEYLGTDDTTLTVEQVRTQVTFLTRAQADAWANGNASEPAITLSDVENGKLVTEVLSRIGAVFADMPKPEED